MAVTYDFQEKFDLRTANRVQGQRTLTRVYQLETSDRIGEGDVDAWLAGTAGTQPGLIIGSPHPDLSGAGTILSDLTCEDEAADGRSWKVTAKWSTPKFGALSPDPLSRPAEFSWSTETGHEAVFKDYSPTPQEVVNSAGLPFDAPPERDTAYAQVQMVRNESPDFFRRTLLPIIGFYGYAVNAQAFKIDGVSVSPYKGRLLIRSAERILEAGVTYYRVTYILQLRNGPPGYEGDGWRERYLDRGHYCYGTPSISYIDGVPHPIRDADGQIVEQAYPLDGEGNSKALATDPPAVIGPFLLYKELDFLPLNFF